MKIIWGVGRSAVTSQMETKKEQQVDPWHAEAAEGEDTIDYDKLISKEILFFVTS